MTDERTPKGRHGGHEEKPERHARNQMRHRFGHAKEMNRRRHDSRESKWAEKGARNDTGKFVMIILPPSMPHERHGIRMSAMTVTREPLSAPAQDPRHGTQCHASLASQSSPRPCYTAPRSHAPPQWPPAAHPPAAPPRSDAIASTPSCPLQTANCASWSSAPSNAIAQLRTR